MSEWIIKPFIEKDLTTNMIEDYFEMLQMEKWIKDSFL
jgi:hypothetical protein